MEKIRHALANKEEEEKKQASLASVRTEFQAKYRQAFTERQHVVATDVHAARPRLKENEDLMNIEPTHMVGALSRVDGVNSSESLCIENTDVREPTSGDTAASGNAASTKDVDLLVAFERVTLSEENAVPPRDSAINPFLGSHQQKQPHYIEVLERSDRNVTQPRFKPNQ